LKSVLVSGEELRYTAMLLYEHYAEYEDEDVCSVCAKNGWFVDFKKQISLHRVRRIEESTSADHVAGAK
jgi:hypothetical protein